MVVAAWMDGRRPLSRFFAVWASARAPVNFWTVPQPQSDRGVPRLLCGRRWGGHGPTQNLAKLGVSVVLLAGFSVAGERLRKR